MPPYNGKYSVPSPWQSMQDLQELWAQGEPNQSIDPSLSQADMMSQPMEPMPIEENPVMNPNVSAPSGYGGGRQAGAMPDVSGIDNIIRQIEAQRNVTRDSQNQGLADLEAMQAKYPSEAKTDLTGLMMFADAFGSGDKNALTSGYKRPPTQEELDKAKIDIGSTIQRLKGQLSGDELAALQLQMSGETSKLHYGQARSDKAQEKYDAGIERDVQKLEKRIEDIGPSIKYNLDSLDSFLGQLPQDENGKIVGDIPGIGPTKSWAPNFALSPKGQEIRQLAIGLVQDAIKVQSGVAVSEQEAVRKMREFGLSWDSTPEQFVKGLKNTRIKTIEGLKKKEAGFRPEVQDVYRERGGFTSKSFDGDAGSGAAKKAEELGVAKDGTPVKRVDGRWVPR